MRTRATIAGLLCAVTGLAAAGLAVAAPAEPGATLASTASCVAAGPKYTALGVSSTEYRLGLKGVTCAFATKWMRVLAVKKVAKSAPTTIPGPVGWKCTGFVVAPGWPLKAYMGKCSQGGKTFSWSPRGMTGSGA